MNKEVEALKANVLKSFSVINTASRTAAKGWDKKATAMPIQLYGEVIKAAKWQKHPYDKVANDFVDNYNKTLDLLLDAAKDSANQFGVNTVPLEFIDITIKQVKDSFIKGLKNE